MIGMRSFSRTIVICLAALAAGGAVDAGPNDGPPAADRQSAGQGPETPVRRFIGSLESLDVEMAMSAFADEATAFFPHAQIASRLDGKPAIRDMMTRAFNGARRAAVAGGVTTAPFQRILVADLDVQRLSDDVAVVTWHAHNEQRLARRSATVVRRGGDWLIANLHSSNIYPPEPAPGGAAQTSGRSRGAESHPYGALLTDPLRTDADRARDPGSRPLEVFAWLGIDEGMVVGDLVPFSGYNTHLLSAIVGARGKVLALYNIERQKPLFDQRRAAAGWDNVTEATDLSDVADDSVDLFVTIRNVHDFYLPSVLEAVGLPGREAVFSEVLRTLKPGGVLAVVDSRTLAHDGVDPDTHRINPERVVRDFTALGFELAERSEMLANPDDDHVTPGFPERWNIDRFALKFRKPARSD